MLKIGTTRAAMAALVVFCHIDITAHEKALRN